MRNLEMFDIFAIKQLAKKVGAQYYEGMGDPHIYIDNRQVMKTKKGGYDLWKKNRIHLKFVKPDATEAEAARWLIFGDL